MNNKDIIISIAADSRKFLQGVQQALDAAEKQAHKSNMTNVLEQKFKDLNNVVRNSHQQITTLLTSVSSSNLDDSAFDSIKDKLKSIQSMFQDVPSFSLDIDLSSEEGMKRFINQMTNGLQKFTGQASDLQSTVDVVRTSFQSMENDPAVKDSAALWAQMGEKIDSLFNSGQKIDKRTKVYKNAVGEILNLYDQYKSEGGSLSLDSLANAVTGSGITDSTSEALKTAYERRKAASASAQELKSKTRSAEDAADRLSNANRRSSSSSDQAADSLRSQSDALEETASQSEKTEDSVNFLTKATKQLAEGWKTVKESITGFTSLKSIIDTLKKLASITISLDDSLTKMALSSTEGLTSLKNFQQQSFALGKSIGATALDVQSSAASFLDLGYSISDTSKLVQSASLYARIENIGIDQATQQIVSSAKAWGNEFADEAAASEAIVDRYSAIGKEYAVNTTDLSSAVTKSAGALQSGGNTLNEAIGLVTAGLQDQDVDTTVNALNILSLRLHDSKAALLDMGAGIDGMAGSASELRDKILALSGVDILKDDGSYKSTAEILREIGSQYGSLSASAKKPLLELIAGKDNASSVESLLKNYQTLAEVILSAESSDGSAGEQNEVYLDSITGKVTQFQNQLQQLASVSLDDSFLKGLVDAGTKLLSLLTSIIDKAGLFPALMATIGGSLSLKNIGRVKQLPLFINMPK